MSHRTVKDDVIFTVALALSPPLTHSLTLSLSLPPSPLFPPLPLSLSLSLSLSTSSLTFSHLTKMTKMFTTSYGCHKYILNHYSFDLIASSINQSSYIMLNWNITCTCGILYTYASLYMMCYQTRDC